MEKSGGRVSYASLSNVEKESSNFHYIDDYSDSAWDVPKGNSTCPSGSRSLGQKYSYQYPLEPEENFEDGYDSGEDHCSSGQQIMRPEVNLKNVLSGIVAIVTGRNKDSDISGGLQFSSSNVSFLGSAKNGETFLHSSVYIPSAPPLLEPTGTNYSAYKDVLEAEPPEWLPDSSTTLCMQCTAPFTALTRGRHHCRFCGGIFCRACSKGRCLLPVKFRERNPQRVCDTCYDRLDPLQSVLINTISNAVQVAKHDVMDWTSMRGWLNLPVGLSMEYEIYKSSNTLRSYCQELQNMTRATFLQQWCMGNEDEENLARKQSGGMAMVYTRNEGNVQQLSFFIEMNHCYSYYDRRKLLHNGWSEYNNHEPLPHAPLLQECCPGYVLEFLSFDIDLHGWVELPIGLWEELKPALHRILVARLDPEKSIPTAVLKGAKGLAILTVVKAGMLVAYKLGSGLVVARKSDGSWSAPSAIVSVGLGWGAQVGGELMDFIIVLHDSKAVKTFCSRMHFSLGAGCSAAAGPVGRVLEADLRAGDRGSGMCYTYSCSKGAFVGVSLEGSIVATRMDTNLRFYGDPYLTTTDILLGTVDRPKAAEPLYVALGDLYSKLVLRASLH
ncbi:unnamed protein product [Camellia sinensis]